VGGEKLEQQQHIISCRETENYIACWIFHTRTPTEMCQIGQYLHSETEVPSYYTHLQDTKKFKFWSVFIDVYVDYLKEL
jgi:hypothetical protein